MRVEKFSYGALTIGGFKINVHMKKSVKPNLHYMSNETSLTWLVFELLHLTKDGRILTLPHFITHYYFSCATNCDCAMKGDLILNPFLAPSLRFSTQSCSMECLSIFECCYFLLHSHIRRSFGAKVLVVNLEL